jgi:pentatricopeptide repeat protein
VYNAVIEHYSHQANLEAAARVYQDMRRAGVRQGTDRQTRLRAGVACTAEETWSDGWCTQVSPDSCTFVALFQAIKRVGQGFAQRLHVLPADDAAENYVRHSIVHDRQARGSAAACQRAMRVTSGQVVDGWN